MERTIYEFKSSVLPYADGKRCGQLFVKLGDLYNNENVMFSIKVRTESETEHRNVVLRSWGIDKEFLKEHFEELLPMTELNGCCFDGAPKKPVAEGTFLFRTGFRDDAIKLLRITEEEADKLAIAAIEPEYFSFLLRKLGVISRWNEQARKMISWMSEKTNMEIPHTFGEKSVSDYHRIDLRLCDIEKQYEQGYYEEDKIIGRYNESLQSKIDETRKRVMDEYDEQIKIKETERDLKLSLIDAGIFTNNFIYFGHDNSASFNWSHSSPLVPTVDIERYIECVGRIMFPAVRFRNERKGCAETDIR